MTLSLVHYLYQGRSDWYGRCVVRKQASQNLELGLEVGGLFSRLSKFNTWAAYKNARKERF